MVTKTDSGDKANPRAIPINPDLVWDYDIPPAAEQSEVFRRWYLARVLTRGRSSDLRAIGFDTIYSYLPSLNLPACSASSISIPIELLRLTLNIAFLPALADTNNSSPLYTFISLFFIFFSR